MSQVDKPLTERGVVANYTQQLQPSKTKKRPASKKLREGLPTITTMQGFQVKLTEKDLTHIEHIVGMGASVEWVAFELGCTVAEFQLAVNNSERVENAVRNGRARDLQEVWDSVRGKAIDGSYQHAAAYLRNKGDFIDNRGDKGQDSGAAVIVVNTGIDRGDSVTVERVE